MVLVPCTTGEVQASDASGARSHCVALRQSAVPAQATGVPHARQPFASAVQVLSAPLAQEVSPLVYCQRSWDHQHFVLFDLFRKSTILIRLLVFR